jgi:hypothetical protein
LAVELLLAGGLLAVELSLLAGGLSLDGESSMAGEIMLLAVSSIIGNLLKIHSWVNDVDVAETIPFVLSLLFLFL